MGGEGRRLSHGRRAVTAGLPRAGQAMHRALDAWPDGSQRNSPSRSHFVATHFSPAVTGAPPCSVRVEAWARS